MSIKSIIHSIPLLATEAPDYRLNYDNDLVILRQEIGENTTEKYF